MGTAIKNNSINNSWVVGLTMAAMVAAGGCKREAPPPAGAASDPVLPAAVAGQPARVAPVAPPSEPAKAVAPEGNPPAANHEPAAREEPAPKNEPAPKTKPAAAIEPPPKAEPPPKEQLKVLKGVALYDDLLKRYCKAGRVDYDGIKAQASKQLDDYIKYIGGRGLPGSRAAKLAFYINAYNALVIKMVVDRSPGFKGVMTVPGFFKKQRNAVAGRKVTLDELENKLIRPTFKEPRIHFALVCGARSCPPLRCRAFSAGGLNRTLEGLTKRFINGRHGVRLNKTGEHQISKLFKWYQQDFDAASGSVGKYLARYHSSAAGALAKQQSFKYLDYSWALNKK